MHPQWRRCHVNLIRLFLAINFNEILKTRGFTQNKSTKFTLRHILHSLQPDSSEWNVSQ